MGLLLGVRRSGQRVCLRVRGQSRLIQQGDIKPDMFLIGGAMWCIASVIGLLAAALP
jgi:hypothetical protein